MKTNYKTKLTNKEIILLCTGIAMCVIAILLWIVQSIIVNANSEPSNKGLEIWMFRIFFCIPIIIIGIFLIIYSVLSHKKIDRPGLTAFGIMMAFMLVIGIITILVMMLLNSSSFGKIGN